LSPEFEGAGAGAGGYRLRAMRPPPPEPRHRGWSFFYGACTSLVGGWIIHLSAVKQPEGQRLWVALIGCALLLAGVWLIFAAISGRIPGWLQDMIDDMD
jgi:hypothetical protein